MLTKDQWILGNTFPCVVFGSFGAFWIGFAITLTPYSGSFANYATNPNDPATGLTTRGFNASFGFLQVFMGVLCLVYSICALRTNLILFLILFLLVPTFGCLAAVFWLTAEGTPAAAAAAAPCLVAGGAIAFVVCMLGWYIFAAILLAAVDFPLSLPGSSPVRFKSRDSFPANVCFSCQSSISPTSSKVPAKSKSPRSRMDTKSFVSWFWIGLD